MTAKKVKPLTADDLMKIEIAEELGLTGKINDGGWKCLTARESGRIGGLMSKRKLAAKVAAKRGVVGGNDG